MFRGGRTPSARNGAQCGAQYSDSGPQQMYLRKARELNTNARAWKCLDGGWWLCASSRTRTFKNENKKNKNKNNKSKSARARARTAGG